LSPFMRIALPIFGVVAVTSLFAIMAGSAGASMTSPLSAARGKLSKAIVALAKKWARARGIPVEWVIATILIESGGKQYAHAQTAREDSYGLMQVNYRVHGDKIAAAGDSAEDLYNPDINIKWGTLILRDAYKKALASGSSHPIDLATRLVYNYGHMPAAPDPKKVVAWSNAMAQTQAIV